MLHWEKGAEGLGTSLHSHLEAISLSEPRFPHLTCAPILQAMLQARISSAGTKTKSKEATLEWEAVMGRQEIRAAGGYGRPRDDLPWGLGSGPGTYGHGSQSAGECAKGETVALHLGSVGWAHRDRNGS